MNSYSQGKRKANARKTQGKRGVFLLMNIYSFRWRSSRRLSLKDILNAVDTGAEFAWRKKLWFEIGKTEVEETLQNCSSNCLVPFFKSCGKEGFEAQILEVLDQGTWNCRLFTHGFFTREAEKRNKNKRHFLGSLSSVESTGAFRETQRNI